MKLAEGVKLIMNGLTCSGKVFINDGVQLGAKVKTNGSLTYDIDAYIPRHTWRDLNKFEIRTLLADGYEQIDYAKSILISKLPDSVIEKIKILDLGRCDDFSSVLYSFKKHNNEVAEFQDDIIQLLLQYSRIHEDLSFHRIVFNPPSIETLTYYIDENKLKFVGFHIDRSTVFDFYSVEKSKNRICINVGVEDRIVYFINLTINQMRNILLEYGKITADALTPDNIGNYFFQEFPDYPVVKVLQGPYEYYIMPTDNVLHDGSSIGKNKHDICLVYLGYLNTYAPISEMI